jgi:hypothetical protein
MNLIALWNYGMNKLELNPAKGTDRWTHDRAEYPVYTESGYPQYPGRLLDCPSPKKKYTLTGTHKNKGVTDESR